MKSSEKDLNNSLIFKNIKFNQVTTNAKKSLLTAQNDSSDTGLKLPGVEILGCGYDVRENYADPSYVKERLFNFGEYGSSIIKNGVTFQIPNLIKDDLVLSAINKSQIEIISGDKKEEYIKNFSNNLSINGKYQFFTGSLSLNFSKDTFSSQNYGYTTIRTSCILYKLILPDSITLSKFLSTEVKNKLEDPNVSALQVLNTYGAYYLKEIIVGGRLDFNTETNKTDFTSKMSIESTAKVAYDNFIGKMSAENQTKYLDDFKSFQNSSTIIVNSYGGKPEKWDLDGNKSAVYNSWFESVPNYAVLSDFTPNSLVPIWNLLDEKSINYEKRKSDFENAMIEYMKVKEIPSASPIKLKIKMTNNLQVFGTDEGSGAKRDLTIYKPVVNKNEYWVGQYGVMNGRYLTSDDKLPVIVAAEFKAIMPPIDWERIWDDSGSGKRKNYSFWKPIPPNGYRALGHFMRLGTEDNEKPNELETENFVCVREDLCSEVKVNNEIIWTDEGTGARDDLSVWKLKFDDNQINSGTFFGTNSRNFSQINSQSPCIYAIKKGESVEII